MGTPIIGISQGLSIELDALPGADTGGVTSRFTRRIPGSRSGMVALSRKKL